MKYGPLSVGSVCSGIGAPEVAWREFGWRFAWQSETDEAASAVLRFHFPTVPNLGDMTTIAFRVRAGDVEAPDVLVGGTPCQSFSVAGLRDGLADARGNLALSFVDLANAIDAVRRVAGQPPCWILWENVPGVFSDADNAFGAILGGLVGHSRAVPPGRDGGWDSAGVVDGPTRCAAWRVLDAQHFGVAQRRRRVYVLARGGAVRWSCADALQPLIEGVRWHPAPCRKAGARLASSLTGSLGRRGGQPDGGDTSGHLIAHALTAEGFDASEDESRRGTPIVPVKVVSFQPRIGRNGRGYSEGVTSALAGADAGATSDMRTCVATVPIVFDTTQITHSENRSNPQPGDPCHTLPSNGHPPAIVHPLQDIHHAAVERGQGGLGIGLADDPMFTLQARTQHGVVTSFHGSQDPDVSGDVTHPVGRNHGQETCVQIGWMVRRLMPMECERLQGFPDGYTAVPRPGGNADQADGPRYKQLGNSMAVPVLRWIGQQIVLQDRACPASW